jgi:hypothetical protein
MRKPHQLISLALLGFVMQGAFAGPVELQQATATYSQRITGIWTVNFAIDADAVNSGWAVQHPDGYATAEIAVFETVQDIGWLGGTRLTFQLKTHLDNGDRHNLGRFRLSATGDDRSQFADGLAEGGDVSANWEVLEPSDYSSAAGAVLTKLPDNSLLASGTDAVAEQYTIVARTTLPKITGIRLETLHDDSLPHRGPGRAPGDGNFVLVDFKVSADPVTGCAAAPSGLVAWWPGEGNANDIIGINHGTLVNGATFAPGMVDQGFSFDGVNDYVRVPDSVTLRLTNELTFELWFKADQWMPVYGHGLFNKRSGSGVNYGLVITDVYGVQLYYDDPTLMDGDFPGNLLEISTYFPLPSVGVFHHFAGTYRQVDATHIELKTYIDGVLIRTRTLLGNLAKTLNSAPVVIGSAADSTSNVFKGVIDEVSLYNRALSGAEIQGIYAAGSAGKCQLPLPPSIVSQPLSQTPPPVGRWGWR